MDSLMAVLSLNTGKFGILEEITIIPFIYSKHSWDLF